MEPFRDDDEALRSRIAELEHELHGLRDQVARATAAAPTPIDALAKTLAAEKHALATARLELARVSMNPRRTGPSVRARLSFIAFTVVGFVVVVVLLARGCRP